MKRRASKQIEVRYHHHLPPPCERTFSLIAAVPSDIWQSIFKFLIFSQAVNPGVKDVLMLGSVCHKWRQISEPLFREFYAEFKQESPFVLQRFTDIEQLTAECDHISTFYPLLERLTNLKTLKIEPSPGVFFSSWKFLDSCTNLRCLSLPVGSVSPNGIPGEVYQKLTNLTKLNISFHPQLSLLTQLNSLALYTEEKISFEGFFDQFSHLTRLALIQYQYRTMTDQVISSLTNLRTLKLLHESKVTDESIKRLTNLTSLTLDFPANVSSASIWRLTNLKKLDIQECDVTNEGIQSLTNLVYLNFEDSHSINEIGLKRLTNLETLAMGFPSKQHSLTNLTKLNRLRLVEHREETEDVLLSLPNLTALDISYTSELPLEILVKMTNLKDLDISGRIIAPEILKELNHLTKLVAEDVSRIKDEHISVLTNLVHLELSCPSLVSARCLQRLPRLRVIASLDKKFYNFDCLDNCRFQAPK